MHVYGDTGTGRSTLALTAPGPIGFAHTAEKIDGIIQRAAREKVVRVINFGGSFGGSPQDISNQAHPVWERMKRGWFDAIDNWARTTIMDTDTEGWEILRLARFGELNPQGRTDALYGPVNAEWRTMFKYFRKQERCNVISIGQTKDEYREMVRNGKKSSERTGHTIRAGQKEIPVMADVVIRTGKYIDNNGIHFTATVEKGWWNAFTEGMTFEDEDIRFSRIMALITETDESEWE